MRLSRFIRPDRQKQRPAREVAVVNTSQNSSLPFPDCSRVDRRASSGVVTPLRTCGSAGGSVAKGLKKISYRGYRFPPEIIHQAIWL
jgi:hypothetical protein